jgi:formylglycine-generating enzyme required for sulfatase activity
VSQQGYITKKQWVTVGKADKIIAIVLAKKPERLAFEPEMIAIKGGSFKMGSPASEKQRGSDEKQHIVSVGDFWMGKTEVTVKQYQQCVTAGGCKQPEWLEKGSDYHIHTGSNKRYKKLGEALTSDNYPIIGVSWHNANEYANWLSKKTGKNYRLPTEAQWEYAARAGTSSAFSFGDTITTKQANFNGNYTYNGSAKGRYLKKTTPVGSYPENNYHLNDMQGNVWEWTCSAYDKNYGGSENNCAKDNDKRSRVLRGGSWSNLPRFVRSAYRYYSHATYRNYTVGFRLSRTR